MTHHDDDPPEWIELAADIRAIDGNHDLGGRSARCRSDSSLLAAARATAPAGLDVERLANAYENVTESMGLHRGLPMIAWLAVAAEYDRLAADSEPVE